MEEEEKKDWKWKEDEKMESEKLERWKVKVIKIFVKYTLIKCPHTLYGFENRKRYMSERRKWKKKRKIGNEIKLEVGKVKNESYIQYL